MKKYFYYLIVICFGSLSAFGTIYWVSHTTGKIFEPFKRQFEKEPAPSFAGLSLREQLISICKNPEFHACGVRAKAFLFEMAKLRDKKIINDYINSIPEQYSVILNMFFLNDLSHEEISQILKIPVGTVKNRIFRAKEKLKELLFRTFKKEELLDYIKV